ncbi:MAG: pyridoxamine 5'-phosphate oxidase family protein [Acetanaerobacterium sp.]
MSRDMIKTAESLIKRCKTIMVASVGEDGMPHQKIMYAARVREGVKVFYLSTNTSSLRVAHFRSNPNASLYFCEKRFFHGMELLGRMEVLEDDEHKRMLWHLGDTQYYPLGVTDPDYCVLRFTAERGRFYIDSRSVDFEVGVADAPA